jgi:uncharacterized protein YcbK (DUF882 family)
MENVNLDQQLTKNFTLAEVVEWPKLQAMAQEDRQIALKLTLDHLDKKVINSAKKIAGIAQEIRDEVNKAFPEYEGKLSIRVLSWFRPKAWELRRGRSGESRHVLGDAIDFIVAGAKEEHVDEIMTWVFKDLEKENWGGGLAAKKIGAKWSFIHIDMGRKRRWTY